MRPRASDALTAATTTHLVPALRPLGFWRWRRRSLARIQDHVLQVLNIQVSAWGGRGYCVNFAAMPLFPERQHLVLSVGGRVAPEGRAEKWWSAATHDSADEGMREVLELVQSRVRPFFDRTRSLSGYANELDQLGMSDHHWAFERGCCRAWFGQEQEAAGWLRRAIALYAADGRFWCEEYARQVRLLQQALEEGGAVGLLRDWERRSIQSLHLQQIMGE